jgi:hypothetical protein
MNYVGLQHFGYLLSLTTIGDCRLASMLSSLIFMEIIGLDGLKGRENNHQNA